MAQQSLLFDVGQVIIYRSATEYCQGKIINISEDSIKLTEVYDIKANDHFKIPVELPLNCMLEIKVVPEGKQLDNNDEKGTNEQKPQHALEPKNVKSPKSQQTPSYDDNIATPSSYADTHTPPSSISTMADDQKSTDDIENPISITLQRQEKLVNKQLRHICYINSYGDVYQSAVKFLDEFPVVGFYCVSDFGEGLFKTSMFVLSTFRMVYIFDIMQFGGQVPKELKNLLTSSWPQKAVHDKDRLDKHLNTRHNFVIKNGFDTLLLHRKVTECPDYVTLNDLIEMVCKVKLDLSNEEHPSQSYLRPLSRKRKEHYAKKAIYLLRMYDVMCLNFFGFIYGGNTNPANLSEDNFTQVNGGSENTNPENFSEDN